MMSRPDPNDGGCRVVISLRVRALCDLGNLGEGGGITHSKIGEHLAIDLHPGHCPAVDERAVGHAILTRCRVDADDPQAAEIALADTAVTVGVVQRVHERLMGTFVQPIVRSSVAFHLGQDLLVPPVGGHTTLDAGHIEDSSSSVRCNVDGFRTLNQTPFGSIRRMRCSSTLWTSVIRSKARLTRGAFRRRKWLFMPCVRWSFPVEVIAKRRFAPLWVFALIFATT